METPKKNLRKIDLLTAVEEIVELSKNSHLEPEFYNQAAIPIKYMCREPSGDDGPLHRQLQRHEHQHP